MNQSELMTSTLMSGLPGTQGSYLEQRNDIMVAVKQGKKFIVLLHHEQSNIAERINYVEGIKVRQFYDSKTRTKKFQCVEAESVPCLFLPDPTTGNRVAHLLDTPRNRKMLATHLPDDRWHIVDDEIRAEIEELAKEIVPVWDSSKVKIRANQQPADKPELSEDDADELIRQHEEHIAKLKSKKKPAETEGVGQGNAQQLTLDDVKKKVHDKYVGVINRIKNTFGNDFEKSSEYQKLIQPEIDKELSSGN